MTLPISCSFQWPEALSRTNLDFVNRTEPGGHSKKAAVLQGFPGFRPFRCLRAGNISELEDRGPSATCVFRASLPKNESPHAPSKIKMLKHA